jgi:hypothetical protein
MKMKKLIVIAALALVSAQVSAAEDKLTQEQACNFSYVSTQCEAAQIEQVAVAPVKPAQPVVVMAVYRVDIPYLNEGYFDGAGK